MTTTMATVLHSQSKSRMSLKLSLNVKLSLMTSSMKWSPGHNFCVTIWHFVIDHYVHWRLSNEGKKKHLPKVVQPSHTFFICSASWSKLMLEGPSQQSDGCLLLEVLAGCSAIPSGAAADLCGGARSRRRYENFFVCLSPPPIEAFLSPGHNWETIIAHEEFHRKMGYIHFCKIWDICVWSCWNIKNYKKICDTFLSKSSSKLYLRLIYNELHV